MLPQLRKVSPRIRHSGQRNHSYTQELSICGSEDDECANMAWSRKLCCRGLTTGQGTHNSLKTCSTVAGASPSQQMKMRCYCSYSPPCLQCRSASEQAGGAARLGAGATRRRMHISAPPAARPFGDRGLRAGLRSCSTRSGPTRRRMRISATPAARPARGPLAASGPEELRDSEWPHGCQRDTVTVCFQYLVPQVTVSDDSTIYSELSLLQSELGVAIRILPFELWPRVLKQKAGKPDQSSYNPNRV